MVKYNTDTKLNIITATAELINELGIENVSVRKIAAKANANVSAIKYHFGSKEEVIDEVMVSMLKEFHIAFEELKVLNIEPRERLVNFFFKYSTVALQYPGLLKNLLISNGVEFPIKFIQFLNEEGRELLINCMSEITDDLDGDVLFIKFFQTISAIAFPTLLGSKLPTMSVINYLDDGYRRKYIEILVEGFIAF